MAVRKTEASLPPGFSPTDLGEAGVSKVRVDLGLEFHLISYLHSPIVLDSLINYVLFVTGEQAQEKQYHYQWVVSHISTEQAEAESFIFDTENGVFEYRPVSIGFFNIEVTIKENGSDVISLNLVQEIVAPDQSLTNLIGRLEEKLEYLKTPEEAIVIGNLAASWELIHNFRRYIMEATNPELSKGVDIPALLVAAIVLKEIFTVPLVERNESIDFAAKNINGELSKFRPQDWYYGSPENRAIGVCQLKAPSLSQYPSDTGAAYSEEDLFNLQRFPKTNILHCARMLRFLLESQSLWDYINLSELMDSYEDLKKLATQFGVWNLDSVIPQTDEDTPDTSPFARRVVNNFLNTSLLQKVFGNPSSELANAYGRYHIRKGDNDLEGIWGGEQRITEQGDYVEQLQSDLRDLGFGIVGEPDGQFGLMTEWAVREFQIYAKMPKVAIEDQSDEVLYKDRLSQQDNDFPYYGPVSGVVNLTTRMAITHWKNNHYRCPVVIGAYENNGNDLFDERENIWSYLTVGSCDPDVYVRDLSGYYPEHLVDPNAHTMIGMHYIKDNNQGPVSVSFTNCGPQNRQHPTVSVTPERLIEGMNTADLLGLDVNQSKKSTFMVVRSIAQVESSGHFDSVNAWDKAIISVGMYHWTLGIYKNFNPNSNEEEDQTEGESCPDYPDQQMCDGEMCAFMALLKLKNPDEYEKYYRFFGVDVDREWFRIDEDGNGQHMLHLDGRNFFNETHTKYSGWIKAINDLGDFEPLPRNMEDANYYRNWHWFYRITMLNRLSTGAHRLNWFFTRIRLNAILNLNWSQDQSPDNLDKDYKLGEIITSEKGIAYILRAHVNAPSHVSLDGSVRDGPLTRALHSVYEDLWGEPSDWDDDNEKLLIDQLKAELEETYPWETWTDSQGNPDSQFNRIDGFTWETENLSETRNSFSFYDDDL